MGTENHSKPGFSRFRVEYAPMFGWFVADPNGKRVSGYSQSKAWAHEHCVQKQEAHDAASKRRVRPCLRCGAGFQSEGIHNRMCNRCRNCASNDEASPFSFGAIHGRKRA